MLWDDGTFDGGDGWSPGQRVDPIMPAVNTVTARVYSLRGGRPGTCKSETCNAPVVWAPSYKGPLNADGTSHFINCPDADKFRGGR